MTRFQRIALTCFIALEVLIFMGAVVRATGSGLGCPDWPFCYGCWVPPTSAEQIDFTKLDLEKFRKKAERLGRDPATITEDSLRAQFDPASTWIEYINRLTSLPLSIAVLALLIASLGEKRRGRGQMVFWSVITLVLLLVNAWLGARVVISGLKPGIITLHMALAIVMLCVLVFIAWRGTDHPWRLAFQNNPARVKGFAWGLFALIVIEGILGSQVREMTDHLAIIHAGENRQQWVAELERSTVYLLHRSFSWIILGAVIWFAAEARKALGTLRWLEKNIVALVLAQMVLGVVLSQIGIIKIAQILHIGLSSLLVSALFLWLLGSSRSTAGPAVA
jgi:heme a synthase